MFIRIFVNCTRALNGITSFKFVILMIDRYSISASADLLKERFSVDVPDFYKPKYNAAPTQLLPVITNTSPKGLSLFYWGTSPEWSKNKVLSEKIVNVRAETLEEKPALKKAIRKSRCIIPADGFYGWKKVGKKTAIPHWFALNSRDPFSMAGLWEEFEDTDGHEVQTFTIITQAANELVKSIQDRMPVIFTKQAEKAWLDNSSDEDSLISLLIQYPAAAMNFYPVAPGISDTRVDLPSMIIPTPPADQHGNLTLFD
jgi:putative SOS response-associated peptidase YedK